MAPQLGELLKALSEASNDLALLFGERFVGLALFGSWARGEAREDSDVDVFVVLRDAGGMAVRSKVYSVIARRVRKPLTLVDIRLKDLLRDDLELTPLLVNVVADAIVIHDEGDILKSFVRKGRQLIRKAGLIRYRTPDGKYGWMRSDRKPLSTVEL